MSGADDRVVADLITGELPWPRVKSLMSSFKDRDRFLQVIRYHKSRVAWQDRILLPIGEKLFIVETAGERRVKCECGHEFGSARKNWKLAANILVRKDEASLREIYPHADLPDPEWMEIREFICPECASLLEVEAAAPGYPIVHDFRPDIDGFYREWLGIELAGPDS